MTARGPCLARVRTCSNMVFAIIVKAYHERKRGSIWLIMCRLRRTLHEAGTYPLLGKENARLGLDDVGKHEPSILEKQLERSGQADMIAEQEIGFCRSGKRERKRRICRPFLERGQD